MTRTQLTEDGAAVVATLARPAQGLTLVAERRRLLVALLAATLASLAVAAVAVPRLDFERAAAARLDHGPEGADMTPHQREEALVQARKVGTLSSYAGAVGGPALMVAGAALFLWAGFKVAGTRPDLRGSAAVAAHGMLPIFLGQLLVIPALVARAPVAVEELPRLLPSSAAAFLPAGASPVLAAALGSLDVFGLWAAVLVAAGMARVAGATRLRAAAVTGVLWLAQVAMLKVVPAALAAQGRHGGP